MLCLASFGVAKAQQTQNLLSENFDNMSSIATSYSSSNWYAYNAGSGNNWTLSSGAARYSYSSSSAANCYLVSAPFSVSADMIELSVSLVEKTGSYTETFEVFFVKASDVTSAAAVASATHYSAIASADYNNTTAATVSGSVTDPALAGQSVRLVVHCTSAADQYYLTVDDINVTETLAPQGPYIMLNPTEETVFTGFTTTLTATYGNATNPTISYTSSNISVATVTGNGTTATVTGVAAGTATITATMTVNGTPYTATCAVTVEDPSYCTPSYSQTSDYIASFTTTGGEDNISNASNAQGTGGYSNFYNSHYLSAEPGTTINFTVTRGYNDSYKYAIWVDWNHDYVFDVATETMVQQTSSVSSDWSSSFTIPADADGGDYHMRVEMLYGSSNTLNPCVSASYGEVEDYKLTVLSPCPKPTGLILSDIATHGVAATWDAETGDVFQYAMVAGANINPSTVTTYDGSITATGTTCSMSWNNLTADNDYTIVIRKNCGNDEYSQAVAQSFTTLETCPKPTNVTASNLTINSAHISWDGEAASYNVKYATATITGTTLEEVFFDDFENGFGNWTTYALGDYTDDTWALTNSTLVDEYHSGSYGALTRSYYNGNDVCVDNWLVSPQMTLGDVLKFWVVGDNNNYQEYFAVYVSTGTNATDDFVMVEAPELAPGNGTWAERTVDLSAYAGQQGYIAIRHTDCAQDFLILDDFGVYKTVNAYSYGTFTTLPPTTETSCNITGLSPETIYVAQVQSDCGSTDGTSSWSSVYFTTPDACSAPTDLVSTDITANTATLSWSDNQDSYNVQYRKVYFFESFEGENLPTGWTTIDANEDGNTWGIFHATTHSGNNGAANLSYIYSSDGSISTTPNDYLVSPLLDLQGTLRVWLSGITASTYAEHFEILLSTTGNSADDFTITLVPEAVTTNAYVEYTADLSSYAGQQGYIAIHHFNCTDQRYLYVDDFGIYGSENWVSVNPNPTDATTTLTGLQPITSYEWQVQGNDCDGNGGVTEWSETASFETVKYPVTVTITGDTSTVDYDGESHTVTGYTATASSELYDVTSDFTFAGVAIATGTNASTDTIYMGLLAEQFENTNPMFDVTFEVEDGWLVITPAAMTVTVTGHTSTVTYDGESHTVTGYDLTCDNTMYSESLVGFSGTAEVVETAAGTYPMGLAASQFSYDNSNFDVTFDVTDGGLTINPINVTVTLHGNTSTVDYDGDEHTVTGYTVDEISSTLYTENDFGLAEGVVASASRTDVGTTNMGLTSASFVNNNTNFNEVTFLVTDGYQKIDPINVTVTLHGNTSTVDYDGDEHTVTGYTVDEISSTL